ITLSTSRADSSGEASTNRRKSNQAEAWPRTISSDAASTSGESAGRPRMMEKLARMARRYLGRRRKYAPPNARETGEARGRGRTRATARVAGNQTRDVADATARTIRLRLAIFSCIAGYR